MRIRWDLSLLLKVLRVYGFGRFGKQIFFRGPYYRYSALVLVIMLWECGHMLGGLWYQRDVSKKIYGATITITHVLFIIKFLSYSLNEHKFAYIAGVLEPPKCDENVYRRANITMCKVGLTYVVMTNLSIVGYVWTTLLEPNAAAATAFLTSYTNATDNAPANATAAVTTTVTSLANRHIVPMHIPYDLRITKYGLGVVQVILNGIILLNGYYHVVIDVTTNAFFIHVAAHFAAVSEAIATARSRHQTLKALHYHQTILRCAAYLQDSYKFLFLGQFVTSTGSLCLSAWMTVSGLKRTDLSIVQRFAPLTLTSFLIYQLYMLTSGADRVVEQSERVWEGAWARVGRGGRAGGVFERLVMARALKPLRFSALHLVPVNNRTFLQVVKNAYGVFAVLTQMELRLSELI